MKAQRKEEETNSEEKHRGNFPGTYFVAEKKETFPSSRFAYLAVHTAFSNSASLGVSEKKHIWAGSMPISTLLALVISKPVPQRSYFRAIALKTANIGQCRNNALELC